MDIASAAALLHGQQELGFLKPKFKYSAGGDRRLTKHILNTPAMNESPCPTASSIIRSGICSADTQPALFWEGDVTHRMAGYWIAQVNHLPQPGIHRL